MPNATDMLQLAALLKRRREAAGLSFRQLAELSGIPRSQLFALEQASIGKVQPSTLEALAAPLGVPLADLYAVAGYAAPRELPSFTPYLRSKYRTLPDEAQDELQQSFARITAKYGYDPTASGGPASGEDEQ